MRRRAEVPIGAVPARLFARELDARGVDSSPALRLAGVARAQLDDPRYELPAGECIALVEALCELAPSEDLGVCAGARMTVADLDLAGLYLRSAATMRDAAAFHETHGPLLERAPLTTHYLTDAGLVISFAPRASSKVRPALDGYLLASTLTVMQSMLGPLQPIEVRLRHAAPRDCSAHVSVLGPSVRFGCDVDALVLPPDVVERALPHRDDAVRSVLEPHLARRIEEVRTARADLPTRVRAAIREDLPAVAASSHALARRLRLSPRSLRRELQAQGTSYSELLAHARCELALQLAAETPRRSGPEIARLLGYAEPHTFYRAFKRWTGVPLSAYRERDSSRPQRPCA